MEARDHHRRPQTTRINSELNLYAFEVYIQERDIMDSTTKTVDTSTGIAITVILHIILLLLLLFLTMPEIKIDPPLPLPIELEAVGSAGGGGGGGTPVQASSRPRPAQPAENTMTAKDGVDSKPSSTAPKPTQNTSTQPAKPVINSNALMGKPSNGGTGGGSGGGTGTGMGTGSGSGTGTGSGSGSGGGIGRSSGNGINLHGLDGRGFREKPGAISKDALAEEGKLVVRVRVDKDGNVREAVTEGFKIPDGIPKTTITDPDQKNLARREALKYKFTAKQGALDEFGYLVFDFKFRN